jgi:anti-sigma factor RsiW
MADASTPPQERPLVNPLPILIVVGMAALAVAILIVAMRRDPGVAAHIANDYMDVAGGLVKVQTATSDAARLSEVVSSQLGARVEVPSLAAGGFVLEGGGVHALRGRPVAYAIYHDALLELVVWHAFAGSVSTMPSPSDVRLVGHRQFHMQQKATNTLVSWQAGPAVAVLTSSLPAERVVQLAASTPRP